jgi:hypothetical protein
MNDKYKKLYQYLSSNGMTDLDENQFFTEYSSNPQKVEKLHSYLTQNKMTDLDANAFQSSYFGVKKKEVSQSTLGQGNTSSARLNNTTTKPTASLSLKGDGTYTFPGQEGVVFEKKGKQWSRKEKDSYEFKPIKEIERINNLEKRAVSLDKYSFEQAPAPKVEETKFKAVPKAAPKKQATPTEKAAQTVFKQDFSALDVNSPEYLKRKAEQEKVNNSISNVDLNLVGMDEEEVVPKLKQSIKDYWYLEVDESGAGYDEVLVRNKVTGESKKISLDNWTTDRDNEESKILRGFLDAQMNTKGYTEAYKRVNDLKSEMADATPTDRIALTEKLVDAQAKLTEEKNKRAAYVRNDKYLSAAIYDKNAQENIKTDLAITQLRTEDYKEKVKDYEKFSTDVKDSYAQGKISKEDYYENYVPKLKAEKEMLFQEQQKLRNDYIQIKSDQQSIDEVAGDTFAIESNRGNVLTGTASAVLKGIESSVRFGLEGLSEEAGGVKEGSLQGVFQQLAPGSVSNMYTNSANRSTFEKIVFGLSESGGAALAGIASGGPAGSLMGLYASSYTNMKDQMNTPEFKDVPEWQKILMSSVYGATVGTLEELGIGKWFTKSPAGKGLTNWILKKVISELPQDATAEAIDLAIKKSFKTAVANGLIQVTSAGLVEGSTELAQEGADMVYKDVFNKLNEKKFFENPNTWEGVLSRLGESFVLGFAGGAGMQSITQTTQTAKNAITINQLNNIENLIENPNIKDIYKMNLKDQILSGEITSTQAKEQLQKLDELEATVNKIPNNVKAENKYQAFQLLNEREDIQKEIAGKDPALVAAQTERINAINEELKTISQNAVQKQTTSEVSVQPGAEVSGEVAQGESQAGSQVATEEGIKEEEELSAVNDRILKIEEAASRGELLEDSEPGELKRLKDRKKELERVEPSGKTGQLTTTESDNVLNSINPTGGIFVEYTPEQRDTLPLGENITTYDETANISPTEKVTVYRGVPNNVNEIKSGDFVTTNEQLAKDYAGEGKVISIEVNANDILDDKTEPLGEEYILRIKQPAPEMGTTVEIEQVATYRAEEQAELLKAIPKIESYKVNGEIDKTLMPKTVLAKYNKIYDKYDKLISPLLETIEQKKNLVNNQKETNLAQDEKIQPERTGNGRTTRTAISKNAPLEGAPTIQGATGPDQQLVSVAEKYADENNIDLKRQGEYVELDEERAKRLADAYEEMDNDPQNPKVKEAYAELIKQTKAQYQSLVDAGYKFWFINLNNPENIDYISSPYNAMRDLRQNKQMGVFPTEQGFGSNEDMDVSKNPLLEDTGIMWPSGGLDGEMKTVTANDLFRAVHDAFGHGLEGAGFRARGEENAWQSHSRLYTGSAIGAMTSETRGQNSWVNYGPKGEQNRTANGEDTIFADQKVGLMPEWTWSEGRAGDMEVDILEADTKDATNLQKVLDALNKVDDDLAKFGRETLGINIPVVTMRAIIKAAKVLVKTGITLQEAIIKASEQLNVSKEDALNAVKFMSETIKAPVKKVLVNEAAALKDQLRLEARAAREAKTDLNTKREQISSFIRSLETKGTITARQAAALVKRVSSLNLDNQTMVDRFEKYAEKVFKRAEYQDLLTSAFRVRRLIRKAIKSENQAEVIGMAKLFSKIDPSLVDDIDNYIELANSVLNAVRPFKQNVKDPALRQAVDIATIAEYATTEIAKQEENRKRELMAEYKYLADSGVLTEDLSVKEMQEIINLIENPTAEFDPEADQKKLDFLQNRLASMEAVFRYMLANNINPFTGEEVVIDPKDADLIKRLLKMDLNEMSVRDAAKVIEAMDNFLLNNITSGLEAAVKSYEGAQNVKQLVAQGKKARPLRSYFSKGIGGFFGEQMISLPLLFEKMFTGIKNAANVMQKMGLTDVINGSNKAIRQHNELMTEYSKQDFYKEDGFMEAKNVYERGMLAFLKRNLTGTKTEIRDEFKRRVDIIKQSIEALRENGTDKEIEMADLFEETYDKLGVSELDLKVIEARAEKMNKDATAWMIKEWGKIYGELADVSLSVYNSILGSDTNYTPDRLKSLSAEDQGLDEALLNSGSGFMMSMDYTDKNKTGVLMEATRPKVLPKGRYISLDFDVNNFNSLKGALVDINTASAIRQVDGFINSKAFNKLIPEAKDRKILKKRINTYIQKAKGKRTVTSDTIKDVERLANFVTGLGVGKALAGLDQPIKQTVPVMINTMINSGGTMTFVTLDMNEAINRSGMPISNRGLESQTAVESIDRLLEKTGGRGAEAIKKLEDLNQFWLKTLLAKPDVWVARSSFITYYLKDMRSKGENVKDINWKTHEWNKDSAQYAQIMVDRQQNISDDKLAGDFLSSDDPTKRIARKVIMPFATFIMNQKARMHNDFLALRSKDTSIEDRKSAIKSLIGLGAELFAYQLIGYGIKTLVYDNIANLLVGDDEEEEKKDKSLLGLKMTSKQYSATKFPVKSIVADILSPLPMFDDLITMGFDKVMENFPQISDDDVKKAVEEKNTILRLQGKDEMDDNAKAKFIDQLKSDNIYSVSFQNDNQSGRKYGMIGIAYDTYKELIDLSTMAYTGEFEDEYQGRVTNKYLPEEDRKILQNISVPLMILYSTGIAPKDLGTVARKVTNIVKKKGVTENQHEKEKEVKKQINRDLNEWEVELVKTRKKSDGVVDYINYVESKGGLTNKQGKEYVKLIEAISSPSDDMLRDIQNEMTADQIIKRNKE